MRIPLWAVVALAVFLAAPAYAGGGHYYGHHGGHRGHHYGHRGHYSGYRHAGYPYRGYGYRHHHSDRKYGYLAAGLLLGAVVGEVIHHRREPERTVVYRGPVTRERVYAPLPVDRVPSYEYDVFYRIESDGSCWLIERESDGSERATRQPDEDC